MKELILEMPMTLDGFVGGPNGELGCWSRTLDASGEELNHRLARARRATPALNAAASASRGRLPSRPKHLRDGTASRSRRVHEGQVVGRRKRREPRQAVPGSHGMNDELAFVDEAAKHEAASESGAAMCDDVLRGLLP
jgi:hypothetical protein